MKRLVSIALLMLLVGAPIAGVTTIDVAVAAGNESTATATPATGSSSGSENGGSNGAYAYEELTNPGTQIEGLDPSSRYLGSRGQVYVSYRETNVIKEMSEINEPEWSVDKVIKSGETVDTREVTLRFSRWQNAPSETVTVHVVTWEKEMVDVSDSPNRTELEPKAANITEQVHEVQLTGGGGAKTVSIPDTDSEKRLSIWIEEYPSARWSNVPYEPVATSDTLPFGDTWGSFLQWFFPRFLGVLALGVPVAILGAFRLVKDVGSGPGKGMVWWIVVPGFLLYLAGYMALGRMAELIVSAPWVMSLMIVALAFIATLEYADETFTLLIEQISTTDNINALGEEVSDIEGEKGVLVNAVQLDGARYAIVPGGSIKKWLLVALTNASWPIIDLSDLETRVDYERGSTEIGNKVADMKLYADELEGDVLEAKWPTLDISLDNLKIRYDELPAPSDGDDGDREAPETILGDWSREKVTSAFMSWIVGYFVASAILTTGVIGITGTTQQAAALGLLPVLKTMSRVEDGWARFVPAAEHATRAKATRVAEKHELTVADTFEEMQQTDADREADVAEMALDIAEARTEQSRQRLRSLLGLDDAMGEMDERRPTGRPDRAAPDGGEIDGD